MAFLVLQTAPAWAGVVPAEIKDSPGYFVGGRIFHDIRRLPALTNLIGHEPHGAVDVPEELPVARAEVVQPGLAVRSLHKSVLGAFAVAGEEDFAFEAVLRQ